MAPDLLPHLINLDLDHSIRTKIQRKKQDEPHVFRSQIAQDLRTRSRRPNGVLTSREDNYALRRNYKLEIRQVITLFEADCLRSVAIKRLVMGAREFCISSERLAVLQRSPERFALSPLRSALGVLTLLAERLLAERTRL